MTANNEIKLKYTLTPRRVNDNQRLNNGMPPNRFEKRVARMTETILSARIFIAE